MKGEARCGAHSRKNDEASNPRSEYREKKLIFAIVHLQLQSRMRYRGHRFFTPLVRVQCAGPQWKVRCGGLQGTVGLAAIELLNELAAAHGFSMVHVGRNGRLSYLEGQQERPSWPPF